MEIIVLRVLLAYCGDCQNNEALTDFRCRRVQGAFSYLDSENATCPRVCPRWICENLERRFRSVVIPWLKPTSSFDCKTAFLNALALKEQLCPLKSDLRPMLLWATVERESICLKVKSILRSKKITPDEKMRLKEHIKCLKKVLFLLRSLPLCVDKIGPISMQPAKTP